MPLTRMAALLYATVSALAVAFQLAPAAGAPWGAYAMGGAVPGRFPPALRIAALVQAALIAGMAAVVLAREEMSCGERWHGSQMCVYLQRERSGRKRPIAILPQRGCPSPSRSACRCIDTC